MTTVDFSTVGGDLVGSVEVTDTELVPDPLLRSVAESWQAKDRSPAEFAAHYDGWSNGYMTAHVRNEQEKTVATTPKLGSGARFKKFVAQVAANGAKDPKAVAAAAGRKKFGAGKFARLAAKKQQSE